MPRIYVTPPMLINASGPFRDILESAGLELVHPPTNLSLNETAQLLLKMDVQGMLASNEPLDRSLLAASKLRVVARMGVGYDSVDVEAATDLDIAVTTTPGAVEGCVAEHTIALLFGVARDLVQRDRDVRQHHWARKTLPRLAGKTLGLIGLGHIGKQVVPKAQGLGMKVVAYDPFPDQEFATAHQVSLLSIEELLATADVVSLHIPSLPETENFINATRLQQMKRGAIFVNTSRGALVDEQALAAALHDGHLLGAGIDVFKIEPPEPDNPLLTAPNTLLCTHMGGLDEQSVIDMSSSAAQCLADLYQGKWPQGKVVNHQLRDGWKW